jgi:hypothetical protein
VSVLLVKTNKKIQGHPVTFGEFLQIVGIWLYMSTTAGYYGHCTSSMLICHFVNGIMSQNKNEYGVTACRLHSGPYMVLIICKSCVADRITPFPMGFGRILNDVPLKNTGLLLTNALSSEYTDEDKTCFRQFIFLFFLLSRFNAFLFRGVPFYTVALYAAWTRRLEVVMFDLNTC